MPAAGVFAFVAKRWFAGTRIVVPLVKTLVKRICPSFASASPLWQAWQLGSCSQPVRAAAPTALMLPWQLWHCITREPSPAFTAPPIAPRRQRVSEPGWQR